MTSESSRSLRSKKLRAALYYAQDGKCAICGEPLPDDWHADHITPWVKEQRTNVHEMQALCPKCNLRKGATVLRRHQEDVQVIARNIVSGVTAVRNIAVHVTPGGGKSGIVMIAAKELAERLGYRVCWVVPRNALRSQGERDFISKRAIFGHTMSIRAAGNDIDPCRSTGGYVTTYQAIAQNPQLHQQEFALRPYILVLDECHHVPYKGEAEGEEAAFYGAVAPLVDAAKIVIFMSGTPERHDGHRMAFWPYVRYPGAEAPMFKSDADHPDWAFVRYLRQDALEERAIVPLHFKALDGRAKWFDPKTGEERDVNSIAEASKRDMSEVLTVVLETEYAHQLLKQCVDSWHEYKAHIFPAAKMLVVAPSIEIAREYSRHLRGLGLHALIATSDDNQQAKDNIEYFKGPGADVLVTVGMAYEGLDVPDITHVACLTNIRSRPWIEQCICRANRVVEGKTHGFIYHPDEPRMVEIMRAIEAEQSAVVIDWTHRPMGMGGSVGGLRVPIVPESSAVTRGRGFGLEDGTRVGYNETAAIEAAMKHAGIVGVSTVQMKQFSVAMGLAIVPNGSASLPNYEEPITTPSEMERKLRKTIDRTVNRIAQGNPERIREINGNLKVRFGPRDQAPVDALQTILKTLADEYGKGDVLV